MLNLKRNIKNLKSSFKFVGRYKWAKKISLKKSKQIWKAKLHQGSNKKMENENISLNLNLGIYSGIYIYFLHANMFLWLFFDQKKNSFSLS